MSYNWNWGVFLQPTVSGNDTYFGWLLTGLKWTVIAALGVGDRPVVVGTIVGVLRTAPNRWLSGFATAYVELFRNIPLLVQLFIWYFVLPELLPKAMGDAFKQSNPLMQQFLSAALCLGLFHGGAGLPSRCGRASSRWPGAAPPGWRWASRCRRYTGSC